MITPMQFWYSSFAIFLAAFVFILWRERDPRFFLYFVFGSIVAFFVFDAPSSHFGYYEYLTQHYLVSFLGVPLSMTIAEGFCIAIAIYMYEKLPWFIGLLKRR